MKTERRFSPAARSARRAALCYAVWDFNQAGGARAERGPHKAGLSSPSVAYLGDEGGT